MNIEGFCKEYNLGTVKNIEKLYGGLMHKMFKVETNKSIYAIKVLNPEVMNREDAYHNFIISEEISNLAKENNIPVSCAISIDGNYLTKFETIYYMVFDYVEGKTLTDEEITVEHCKKIGKYLARIHNLDKKKIDLKETIIPYKRLYDWEGFSLEVNFSKMSYKEEYLKNYKKYNSILKRANERFNQINNTFTICHRDMDPKNVMWNKNNPIIIDWESASLANPYRELLETALSWSGFLSNNFDKEKFKSIFLEYQNTRSIQEVDWSNVISGNLVGRFGWLKYNLERSLEIITKDKEEVMIAEKEVSKTIDEINRYLELVGTMYDSINEIIKKEDNSMNKIIEKIISQNTLLQNKSYKAVTTGFTNTIYQVDKYIIKICTKKENELNFKNEINFYEKNKENKFIPKLYLSDTTKIIIPYYYEILEKKEGKTLYEVWYKLAIEEKKEVISKVIDVLKSFHNTLVEEYDFINYLKEKIKEYTPVEGLDETLITKLLNRCDIYFKENQFGMIHGDLHFDNLLYDNKAIVIIDFECSMAAPIDYEFRFINRYNKTPWKWASEKTDMLTVENDYKDVMPLIIENYKALQNIKYLKERLLIYEVIDLLKEYNATKNQENLEEVKSILEELEI